MRNKHNEFKVERTDSAHRAESLVESVIYHLTEHLTQHRALGRETGTEGPFLTLRISTISPISLHHSSITLHSRPSLLLLWTDRPGNQEYRQPIRAQNVLWTHPLKHQRGTRLAIQRTLTRKQRGPIRERWFLIDTPLDHSVRELPCKRVTADQSDSATVLNTPWQTGEQQTNQRVPLATPSNPGNYGPIR